RTRLLALGAVLLLLGGLLTFNNLHGEAPTGQPPEKKFEDFDRVVKGTRELEGLFHLYTRDDAVFMEIRSDQFDKPFLCPIAIAHGLGMGGETLNTDSQWILLFKRVGDKVQLIRRNVRFQAKRGTAVARAVETTYTDSVLLALHIATVHPVRQNVI